ncbi:hypothetical protein MTO96_019800 [Rhipicephalus appendiculatus]
MATASTHTVFGFDCALDWRPTSFVEAIPSSYVCSACELVPRVMTMLPCSHKLCPQCCIHVGRRINHCPLDKKAFDEKDVSFSTLRTESILSRRVRCWNAEHGCGAEDAASAMLGTLFAETVDSTSRAVETAEGSYCIETSAGTSRAAVTRRNIILPRNTRMRNIRQVNPMRSTFPPPSRK